MKRQPFPSASIVVMIGLLLPACQMQNWQIPSPESASHAMLERHPESVSIRLYIPSYLSEVPSFAKHFPNAPPHRVIDALKKKVESQNESNVFEVTEVPPDTGLFCSLRLEELERPGITSVWSGLTMFTAWLIPFYDDSLGYKVTYELFEDAKLKKRYQYLVRGKELQWVAASLILPFVSSRWQVVNSKYGNVSERLLDELLSTSRLFLEDVRHDGIVRVKI